MVFITVAILFLSVGVLSYPTTERADVSDMPPVLDVLERVAICAFKAKKMEADCAKENFLKCTAEATSSYIKCIAGSIDNLEPISADEKHLARDDIKKSNSKNAKIHKDDNTKLMKRFASFQEFKTSLQSALDRVNKCCAEVKTLDSRWRDVGRMTNNDQVTYFLNCISKRGEEKESVTKRNQVAKKHKRSIDFNDISTYDSADAYYDSESGCLDDEFDPERLQKAERFNPELLKPRKEKRSLLLDKVSQNSIDFNDIIAVEQDPKKCVETLLLDIIHCFTKKSGKDNLEERLVRAITKFMTCLKKK